MPNDHSVTGARTTESTGPYPTASRPDLAGTWVKSADVVDSHTREGHRGIRDLDADMAETIFEVMVALMWSDGALTTPEVERGRAAARVMRVKARRGGAFGAIAEGALPFPEIDFGRLDPSHRQLAYASAAWVDLGSAQPSARRTGFMRALQARLELADQSDALEQLAATVSREHQDPEAAFVALVLALIPTEPTAAQLD
jgi:hypothetical protein